MARIRRTCTPQFKIEAVKLVTEQGYSIAEAARSLGLSDNLLRNWKQALKAKGEQAFPGQGKLSPFEEENRRPRLRPWDRLFWAWLSRWWTGWKDALAIVAPATVVGWHRLGFRLYWRWKSPGRPGRPRIDPNVRRLIRRMSVENPLWGRARIQAELRLLGHDVAESTVAKYMVRRTRPPSPTWRAFLANHVDCLASVDFFVVPTVTFQLLYAFVVLCHDRRRVAHFSVTTHPTAQWGFVTLWPSVTESRAPEAVCYGIGWPGYFVASRALARTASHRAYPSGRVGGRVQRRTHVDSTLAILPTFSLTCEGEPPMFLDTRLGNTPRWFMEKPKDWGMRVHDTILDCVVFVGRILQKGNQEEKRLTGTAFVVEMPHGDGVSGLYLVTAKHVADRLVSGGEWFIRFNTNDGGCDEVRGTEKSRWWTHPDPEQEPSVDVAVMPLPLPPTAWIARIPTSMFVTDEVIAKRLIGPGSDVFVTGLFTKMTGKSRNIPLMRMANIAMMPTEKVPNIRIGGWVGESEVYLLEARSLGGLSGSPAFALETLFMESRHADLPGRPTARMGGIGEQFLLGLMNGHWLIRENESNSVEIESVRDSEGSIATGISVVVPAKKILEVLNHPELERMRGDAVMARLAAQGFTVHP